MRTAHLKTAPYAAPSATAGTTERPGHHLKAPYAQYSRSPALAKFKAVPGKWQVQQVQQVQRPAAARAVRGCLAGACTRSPVSRHAGHRMILFS